MKYIEVKGIIGRRIKELRKGRGLSQEALAEKMGISSKYLSSIERGMENPTLDTLIALTSALGVEFHEVFEFSHLGRSPQELKDLIRGLVEQGGEEKLILAARLMKAVYL